MYFYWPNSCDTDADIVILDDAGNGFPSQKDASLPCPLCRTFSEIPASALGTEIPCPHCGKPIKLNSFTINAEWRPVAKAWRMKDVPGEKEMADRSKTNASNRKSEESVVT